MKALRWVLYARRPLHLEELQSALRTIDNNTDMRGGKVVSLETILTACSNLIVTIHESRTAKIFPSNLVIRPIHFSVQQYLTSKSPRIQSSHVISEISDGQTSHAELASACISHLTHSAMHTQAIQLSECESVFSKNLLTCYAARFFDAHVLSAHGFPHNGIFDTRGHCVKHLLESDEILLRNVLAFVLRSWWTEIEPRLQNYAVYEVLSNIEAEQQGEALATIEGPVAAILVDTTLLGEIPNVRERYATQEGALQAMHFLCKLSTHNESWELNKTLLRLVRQSVDAQICDNSGHTALHITVIHHCPRWARILIERGADINSRNSDGTSILEAAAALFDCDATCELISLLVTHGADVNAGSRKHISSLSVATWRGSIEVVRLLLQYGASVSLPGNPDYANDDFGLPLQEACRAGQADIVKVLLEHGAGANTILMTTDSRRDQVNDDYDTCVMRALLDHGTHLVGDWRNAVVLWKKPVWAEVA